MDKKFKLFCFGFGQVAKYFVKNLIKKKIKFELITTNTKKTQIKKFNNKKNKSYYFFNNKFDKKLLKDLNTSQKVLISIPPKNREDIVLKEFSKSFKKQHFNWVTYLSATSVYGDKKGKWVDEKTTPKPITDNGLNRLIAEKNWLKLFKKFNLPIQIFRLSGIYSRENNIIKKLKKNKFKLIEKKNHFFSRIHVEDIAEFLTLSLGKFHSGQVYNLSDNYPSTNNELAEYAAQLMKTNLPKKIKYNKLKNKKIKKFYKVSKKVSNKKIKKFFKYNLKYPTFKEGLKIIKN